MYLKLDSTASQLRPTGLEFPLRLSIEIVEVRRIVHQHHLGARRRGTLRVSVDSSASLLVPCSGFLYFSCRVPSVLVLFAILLPYVIFITQKSGRDGTWRTQGDAAPFSARVRRRARHERRPIGSVGGGKEGSLAVLHRRRPKHVC